MFQNGSAGGKTLCAHWREAGEHYARTEGRDIPLVDSDTGWTFPETLTRYDWNGKPVGIGNKFSLAAPDKKRKNGSRALKKVGSSGTRVVNEHKTSNHRSYIWSSDSAVSAKTFDPFIWASTQASAILLQLGNKSTHCRKIKNAMPQARRGGEWPKSTNSNSRYSRNRIGFSRLHWPSLLGAVCASRSGLIESLIHLGHRQS